jgi:predicted alpha/beta superfamily hydrolase
MSSKYVCLVDALAARVAHPTDLRKHEFRSALMSDTRELVVYCPPEYDDGQQRYSVLYLQDGQNLFDATTAFIPGMDWKVDETAETLILEKAIQPLIIVGIYNAGEQRIGEYTPTRDPKLGGGRAELYGRVLVEEIKPFIDREYRTLPDAGNTGLGGSSLGGLVTLFLGLRHPDVFRRLAVMSPSVWWSKRAITAMVKRLPRKLPLKIWLDIGTEEGETHVANAKLLRDALVAKGWREGEDLRYTEIAGATHSEAAWAERVSPVLRFLFPAAQ